MSLLKQPLDKPLFPDLIWSRPENRRFAGKLLIIGGHAHSLSAPAKAFASAEKAGIGTARVVLPDATQKILGKSFLEAEFVPSTPSGSFGTKSLAVLLDSADWSDGVLLAGDFGRNSETAILFEKFLNKYSGRVMLSGDSMDYFLDRDSLVLQRPKTTIVASFSQLQKLFKNNYSQQPLFHSMDIAKVANALERTANSNNAEILTEHEGYLIAVSGRRSSITAFKQPADWQIPLAAYASVWSLQQPNKMFEALTTAIYCFLSD